MIILAAALLQSAAPITPALEDRARFDRCVATAAEDAEAAIDTANAWIGEGGGLLARQCLGTAFLNAGQGRAALTVFVGAATAADAASSAQAGALWALAGNAALAGGDAAAARGHFDLAIAGGRLAGSALGVAHADRARARVALSDPAGARTDLNTAMQLAPDDGAIWLLSATLARRMRDYGRAQADVQQAAALSPRDPAVALEAGNIAYMVDNLDAARRSWESVIAIAPTSSAAATARAQLADLRAEATATPAPPITLPNPSSL